MAPSTLSNPTPRTSIRLVLSYVLDWIVLVYIFLQTPSPQISSTNPVTRAIAGVGAAFSRATPYHRPFDLTNPEISFPHIKKEKIPVVALGAIALAGPAVIIFLICLLFVPG
jgi:hypothetical protein